MKRSTFPVTMAVLVILSLILSSCNFPGANTGPSTEVLQQTAIAQTVVALQTQLAAVPTMTAQPQVDVPPTATLEPVIVPTATLQPTVYVPPVIPTVTNTPMPTYMIGQVADITYPDNTAVKPGEKFTKTWRLTNGGSATWNSSFKLVFISGDAMSGTTKTIGKSVAPGQSVDVSVELTAPATNKTYQGNWMLQTDSNMNFGWGPNANNAFWVKVVVSVMFAVTDAIPSYSLPSGYTCPVTVTLAAAITATAPGKVTYYFITSSGNTAKQELVFSEKGTKNTLDTTISVGSTPITELTVTVYIDNPNHQEFTNRKITIPITCP